ncbi:putative NRPS-like protein biosynthetic cluster [Elasticomyces elasticus]|nr:putative NRPS-like protein biosynthetic cluster [Elasticomyces elasticus]
MDPTKSGGPVGQRLLPQIVDAYAEYEPDRIWGAIARSSDLSEGFRNVTFKELAHCINYVAWSIDRQIGRSSTFEALSYIGASDLRYAIFAWAAVKCGYQTLLPSVRNSESGNLSLLHDLNCTKVFCSTDQIPKLERLKLQKTDLQIYTVPLLEEMLALPVTHYPYEKTFAEAENDPIICCHTSGSTGAPKPIQLTNHYFAAYDNHRKIPQIEGRGRDVDYATFDTPDCAYYYNTFPPFHIAGIIAQGMIPILYNTTVLLGPADKPPSGEICSAIMRQVKIHSIYTPPTVLEQLLLEPGGLEQAGTCNFIIFSGGPLAPSTGDQVAKVTDLGQYIGSTEIGIIPGILPRPETWRYFEFHPVFGCELDHVAENQYELVIPHDPSLDWIRPAPYRIAPKEWRTKDLFKQHPDKPYAFGFHGRADDIVVLGNGEKFNPVTMEAIIQGAPPLSGAIIVGQGRFQAALMVEPKVDTPAGSAQDSLIVDIWPWIQKANTDGPAHAQIFRSKVLVTSPDKPFVRAGKGTVVRGQSTKLYEKEIEALYSDKIQDPNKMQGLPELDQPLDQKALENFICSYLSKFRSMNIGPDDDFYVNGIDSLQTLEFTNGLKARLHPHVSDLSYITSKAVYHHPTAKSLAEFYYSRLNGSLGAHHSEDEETRRVERMKALVQEYTQNLPTKPANDGANGGNGLANGIVQPPTVVLLTGSTGTLGTNILQALLEDPTVSKIYCLDRSAESQNRHNKRFASRGLSHLLDTHKIEFLKAQFGRPGFGQDDATVSRLLAEVDVIIHNAWKVDFNHQLESFAKEQIRSVRNFIDWSLNSKRHPHIIFVSSLSSVGQWSTYHPGPVLEAPFDDYRVAQALGYGESKHVAERILQEATARAGVPVSILRVGQIAGPTDVKGTVWSKAEYLPSLIQTSKALGRIPKSLPDAVDWVPVDKLAHIILDLMHDALDTHKSQIFNLVNPQPTEWETLVPAMRKLWANQTTLSSISFKEWVRLLQSIDVNNKEELAAMPSVMVKEFYEEMQRNTDMNKGRPTYETRNGMAASKTMKELQPIDERLMGVWLEQWGY